MHNLDFSCPLARGVSVDATVEFYTRPRCEDLGSAFCHLVRPHVDLPDGSLLGVGEASFAQAGVMGSKTQPIDRCCPCRLSAGRATQQSKGAYRTPYLVSSPVLPLNSLFGKAFVAHVRAAIFSLGCKRCCAPNCGYPSTPFSFECQVGLL